MRYDLWVDFNDIYHGRLQSLVRFAKNPSGIRKGERITVSDSDNLFAKAQVLDVYTNMVVFLELDITTFWEGT